MYIDKEHDKNGEQEREDSYMFEVCGVSRGAGDPDDYGYPGQPLEMDVNNLIIIDHSKDWQEVPF